MKDDLREKNHSKEILQSHNRIELTRIQKYGNIDPNNYPPVLRMNNDTLNYFDSLKRLKWEVSTQQKTEGKIPETISILLPSYNKLSVTRLKKQLGLPITGLKLNSGSKYYSIRKYSTIKNAGASPNTLAFHARFQPIILRKTLLNFNLWYLDEEQNKTQTYFDSLFNGNLNRKFKARFNKTDRTEGCYKRFKVIGAQEYGIKNFKNWLKRSPKTEFNDQSGKEIVVVNSHTTLDRIINDTVKQYKDIPRKRWDYRKILRTHPRTVYEIGYNVENFVRAHPNHFDFLGLKANTLSWDIGDEKHAGTEVFELLLNNPEDIPQLKPIKKAILDFLLINNSLNGEVSELYFTTAPYLTEGFGGKEIKEFQNYMLDLYAVDQNNKLRVIFELKGRTAFKNNSGLHDSFPEMMDLMYLSMKHPDILCAWVDICITNDLVIFSILPTKKKELSSEISMGQIELINPMLYKVMRSPELQQFIGEEILSIWKTGLGRLKNPNSVLDQVNASKLVTSKVINGNEIKKFTSEMMEVIKTVAEKYSFDPSIIQVEEFSRAYKKQINFLKSHKFPDNLHKWTPGRLWKTKMNVALQLDYYEQYLKYLNG